MLKWQLQDKEDQMYCCQIEDYICEVWKDKGDYWKVNLFINDYVSIYETYTARNPEDAKQKGLLMVFQRLDKEISFYKKLQDTLRYDLFKGL